MIEKNLTTKKTADKNKIINKQDIRQQATVLADLLAESGEYLQYIEAKKRLSADREQLYVLNELRQQQFNLRFASMLGEDTDDESADLETAYSAITKDPLVCDFLYAEGRFLRLVSDVQEVFSAKLETWNMFSDEENVGVLN
ncbi:MAG: YlbF family regulator [Clostridiales bacterium]